MNNEVTSPQQVKNWKITIFTHLGSIKLLTRFKFSIWFDFPVWQNGSEKYFLESGDKIRFFFEDEAFNKKGQLRVKKENSINKIGHALHDLDDIFNKFTRNKKLYDL